MTDPEDPISIGDHARPLQARVHLIVGPVGAGKSTRAIDLAARERAVRLTLDDWMAALFSPDRPVEGVMGWYVERAERAVDQIWRVALEILRAGTSVILEIGLLQRSARDAFYARVDEARVDGASVDLVLHVVDAPRDVRRARVAARNVARGETFSMVVPPAIFELASDLWEPPDDAEIAARSLDARSADQPFLRST